MSKPSAARAASSIVDERTGIRHDYQRQCGIVSTHFLLPVDAPIWANERSQLWNAAEQAETRKNATVAREFEIALPDELTALQRQQLALTLAQEIVSRHCCVADVAIHAPSQASDQRNHHAHILLSTRQLTENGFGLKTRELDDQKLRPELVQYWRERFADLQNHFLAQAGCRERVDHRRFKDQGLEQVPTTHLGPAAVGYERRTGLASRRRLDHEAEVSERLLRAKQDGEPARQAQQLAQHILDLDSDLNAALAERERWREQQLQHTLAAGVAAFKAKYQQHQQAKTEAERSERQQQEAALQAQQQQQARLAEQQRLRRQQAAEQQAQLLEQQRLQAEAEERQRLQRLEQWLTQEVWRQWQLEREQQHAHWAQMAEEASQWAAEQSAPAPDSEAEPEAESEPETEPEPQRSVRRDDDGPGWF